LAWTWGCGILRPYPARYDRKAQRKRRRLARLVEENSFIRLEDLNIQGMLAYKGDWVGCQVEKVSRWYPSCKTCSAGGTLLPSTARQVRAWQCPVCDVVHDRDVNAATNVLNQTSAGAAGIHTWGQPVQDLRLLRQPGNAG
jgi:transposase